MSEVHNTPTTARAASRRELLTIGLFAGLAGVAGKTFAALAPAPSAPLLTRSRAVKEAELLRTYRNASPTEKAAILRFLERVRDGDDMHTAGVEFLTTCGWTEADARARTAAVLSANGKGAGA